MKTALSFILLVLMAVQAIATDGLLIDLIVPPRYSTVLCLYEADTSIDCARFDLDWVTQ
jgi:hypothetical protein